MKVILLADVKKLGKKDQTIEVSDGYAVNFLFPRKLAVQVTKKSVEVLGEQQEERRQQDIANREKAQDLAEKLKKVQVEFGSIFTKFNMTCRYICTVTRCCNGHTIYWCIILIELMKKLFTSNIIYVKDHSF